MAALEAMACGVPVVASRVGGLPEIIEDDVSGYLCDPDDIAGMAERSLALLTDAERHARLTRAAARVVTSRFCTDAVVPTYEAYYEEVLRSPARG